MKEREVSASTHIHATSKDMADPSRLAEILFHNASCHPTLKCSIDAVNHSHIDAAGTTWRVNVGVYTNNKYDNPSGGSYGTVSDIKDRDECLKWCHSKDRNAMCEFNSKDSHDNCWVKTKSLEQTDHTIFFMSSDAPNWTFFTPKSSPTYDAGKYNMTCKTKTHTAKTSIEFELWVDGKK